VNGKHPEKFRFLYKNSEGTIPSKEVSLDDVQSGLQRFGMSKEDIDSLIKQAREWTVT
jgi:hypothetical protein